MQGERVAAASFDEILHLEQVNGNRYQGATPPGAFAPQGIYGGQLIAQAIVAASRTAEGRYCHSLHAYFLRPGDAKRPVSYEIEAVRDGRTFATRQVIASQEGKELLRLILSFKYPESGPIHQGPMPVVPGPEDLAIPAVKAAWETAAFRSLPLELRRVTPEQLPPLPGQQAVQRLWFRAIAPFHDDTATQQAVLAYVTDMGLLSTTMLPHGLAWTGAAVTASSLDHALWFHHLSDMRDWHLFDQHSPSAGDARGLGLGSIWRADGLLVATVAQEGLIRTP